MFVGKLLFVNIQQEEKYSFNFVLAIILNCFTDFVQFVSGLHKESSIAVVKGRYMSMAVVCDRNVLLWSVGFYGQ